MSTLEVTEKLKEIIKEQSEIIYDMAVEMEHSRNTGGYITDTVSEKILGAATRLYEVSNAIQG